MNQEMQNVANAIMYSAIMHDKKQEELENKARKYDELKVAIEKIKSEVASNAVPIQDGSEEWRSRVNDVVINIAEAIHRYTEELI